MLISIEELRELKEFQTIPEKTLKRKIRAIEIAIRKYTNNNFQNRLKRVELPSSNNILNGTCQYFKIGDTIEISESVNAGLYTIKDIDAEYIKFEEDIFDESHNLCTKIEYPVDIIDGAIDLLKWEISGKNKIGISSETLSRHSVTYQNLDVNNSINGYPIALFSFCDKYKKARF